MMCGQVEMREAGGVTARQVHFNCLGVKENEKAFKRARSPFTD